MYIKKTSISILFLVIPLFFFCSDKSVEPQTVIDDGWEIATPTSQGMSAAQLSILTHEIENGDMGLVSSLLIIRNGKLIYEEYFRDMDKFSKHSIFSVTKSFTSAMIGIAIEEGLIGSVDDRMLDYLPQYDPPANFTDDKDSMRIEHLLQMRAGFEWEEIEISYYSNLNSFSQMYDSDDLVKYVLDRPMTAPPGNQFEYNTGASMVLGAIISHEREFNTEPFAQRTIFEPLGITDYNWVQRHNGFVPTGTGLQLTPRDMAKFGLLYLNDGIIDNDTIVPPAWIEQSWLPYSIFSSGDGYGYHWWLMKYRINNQDVLIPTALGWGNQYIFVIKELNMVVVSTAENYEQHPSHIREILQSYIISAVN